MPHPVDVLVGRRIAELRTAGGLSGRQLAKALGVSAQQVQKYERGCNRISASRLWLLASILNVPPHAFFEGADGAAPCCPEDAPPGRDSRALPVCAGRRCRPNG